MNNIIDSKIKQLRELTDEFIFIEYYSHTDCNMYKILNEYTKYNQDKLVLCSIDDGIEKALDMAIEEIGKYKTEYYENETSI